MMKGSILSGVLLMASIASIGTAHSQESLDGVNLTCVRDHTKVVSVIEFQGTTVKRSFSSIENIKNEKYNFEMEVVEIKTEYYGYTATEGAVFACKVKSFEKNTCPVKSTSSLERALSGEEYSADIWFMIDRYNLDFSEGIALSKGRGIDLIFDRVMTTFYGKCFVAGEEDVQNIKDAMNEDKDNSIRDYHKKILEMKAAKKEF